MKLTLSSAGILCSGNAGQPAGSCDILGRGPWQSRALARAVFGMFLGKAPLDAQARVHAGQTLVYLTNGFK